MSGDSPSAFTNENVFDFKEAHTGAAATTSKDQIVSSSALAEPPEGGKAREKDDRDDDEYDLNSPILNNGTAGAKPRWRHSGGLDGDTTDYQAGVARGGPKDEQSLLNGGLDRLPKPYERPKEFDEESDDGTCVVNCIYYTMECCKCSIM